MLLRCKELGKNAEGQCGWSGRLDGMNPSYQRASEENSSPCGYTFLTFCFPHLSQGGGSEARKLLPENRILWVKGRWDKFLEDRQERIIAKYIKASAAGSWEGNVLEEAVRGEIVKCSALALAMAFVSSKTAGFLSVN